MESSPPIKKPLRFSGMRLSPADFARIGLPEMVYVRAVQPGEVVGEDGQSVPLTSPLYAIHAADGAPMALAASRELAFAEARAHDLNPLSVH